MMDSFLDILKWILLFMTVVGLLWNVSMVVDWFYDEREK